MKIYVIQKLFWTGSEYFENGEYDFEVCKDVGAFDNFEDAFNTIFSCIKRDVDEYRKEFPKAEIEEPTVNKDKSVEFSVYRHGDDSERDDIEYCVVELELNRKENE